MSPRDEQDNGTPPGTFEKTIAATLERSLDELDEVSRARLSAARARALRRRRWMAPVVAASALAAGVAVMAVLPTHLVTGDEELEGNWGYYSVNPELLDTMDMLSVLGDSPDGG